MSSMQFWKIFRSHICLFDKLYSSIISIEKFVIPFPSRLIDFRHERVEVIPVGPSKRTACTSERNRDYKAFIAQLPTSGRSLLICIKIGEYQGRKEEEGGREKRTKRKNGSLIRDQIMILRGSRLMREMGRSWWRSLRVLVSRRE